MKRLLPFIALIGLIIAFGYSYHMAHATREQNHLRGKVIFVDAGHGGYDPGTVWGGVKEKDVTLAVAKKLAAALRAKGARPVLSRETDTDYALPGQGGRTAKRYDYDQRIKMGEKAGALVAMSIHVNSTPYAATAGAEVFYDAASAEGKLLAESIQNELRKVPEMEKRLAKTANFYFIKKCTMPAVVVEVGYLSNPRERVLLQQEKYQEQLAAAIAAGLDKYFAAPKPPKPSPPAPSKT